MNLNKTMLLHDVPRNSKISLPCDPSIILTFANIDGMYSLCYDNNNIPVHLASWTEVVFLEKL